MARGDLEIPNKVITEVDHTPIRQETVASRLNDDSADGNLRGKVRAPIGRPALANSNNYQGYRTHTLK